MEETHEYANELGKQGGKNPRKIPKFTSVLAVLSKKSKITPTHSSYDVVTPGLRNRYRGDTVKLACYYSLI